jgi:hypothetical protein
MSRFTTIATTLTAVFLTFVHDGAAQPPRPPETARAVTLSVTEYNRLIDLAGRPPQAVAGPPVAAVLSSADLRVRVDRETARGVFNVTGDVLRSGVSRVNLLAGATIVNASAGGRPLPLIVDGTAHTALLPGPGPFALTLEWGAPLTFMPGRASFVLPAPPAGTVRATIDLPGEQADVHLSSGLVTRRTVNAGRTIVDVTLTPGSSNEVWWSMRDSAPVAAAREARIVADVMTLLTLGDSDVRMVALIDVTVVQGEPRTIEVRLPAGYELTSIAGGSLETGSQRDGGVTLSVGDPAARRHQFLVSLERSHRGGSFTIDTGFVTVSDVQRERGEVAVEGVGTLELTAADREGMHRIDVRELKPALQSLARLPILSAFRYQRNAGTVPGLALDARRFADAGVLAAFAERGTATTLITAEGRALTEVVLNLQNRAQPFLKVTLPVGASIVSVEVAGETAKPALGADGTRVPLLRPGFRPQGTYTVSFVYLHAGTPFARKGDLQMTLPKMDVPVGQLDWEIFVPEHYSVRATGGNVIDERAFSYWFAAHLARTGIGSVAETVTVTGAAPRIDRPAARAVDEQEARPIVQPSQNVVNLQRRAAGVLPVRVDVPRAGTSHQFVKPLVVDQEAVVSFRYKRR